MTDGVESVILEMVGDAEDTENFPVEYKTLYELIHNAGAILALQHHGCGEYRYYPVVNAV